MARASKKMTFVSAFSGAALLFATLPGAAFAQDPAAQGSTAAAPAPAPEKHHSKLKGAAVGGVGGAVLGGKKGAAAGAAGGALWQHHKNKKAEKAAAKGQ